MPEAIAAADQTAALDALEKIDPAKAVVIEGIAPGALPGRRLARRLREARISKYTPREIFVDVNVSDRGWLVLTDNFFDGWKAYLRPFGATGEGVTAAANPSSSNCRSTGPMAHSGRSTSPNAGSGPCASSTRRAASSSASTSAFWPSSR